MSDVLEHLVHVDAEVLLMIADAIPEAKSPDKLVASVSGDPDTEFLEWWIPEQMQWQQRAVAITERLVDLLVEGDMPEWVLEWWAPIIEFPWAERLGEAVEAAETWLNGK
jgi:hypothetical protein